ncbi:hypothetical protein [Nocardioides sp. WS12]|uniref:hypothetical protein n=1 Tax=Nocardioides sp. WS12 TaxID=2486272 RepID=UPI0015FD721F|nr:hypothetical protein [Nocardioides sp. WS12]
MSTRNPEPTDIRDAGADPAKDDDSASDWASEGGATEHGPATHVEADDGPPDR